MNRDQLILTCVSCGEPHIRGSESYLSQLVSCRDRQRTEPRRLLWNLSGNPATLGFQTTVIGSALGFAMASLAILEHLRF